MSSEARVQTNRLLAKAFDLNDFLDPTRLAHDELQYYNDITRALDKTIDKYVEWLDSEEARELFHEGVKAKKEYFNAIDKDLDDIIQDTSLSADGIIEKIYQKGLNYGYKDINRLPVFNDACKYGLKATREYNFDLICNVSDDLRESIKHNIFRGVAEGQSVQQVAKALVDSGLKPLEGKTLSAYQRASLIARTEIARSMTTGRLQAYANYGVEKVKILTAGDDYVCPICLKAAHKFNGEMNIENVSGDKLYTLEEASDLVPFHPACRCSVMAYIEHYQLPEKPIDNPKFMDCSPDENILLPSTSWSKRDIKESLIRLIDEDELDEVAENVFDFILNAEEFPYIECGASFDLKLKPIKKFIKGTRKGINIPDNEKGIGLTIHSHTSGLPFPSKKDIKTILSYNSKYNIIYTRSGLIVVKNNLKTRVTLIDELCEHYEETSKKINAEIERKRVEFKQQAINNHVVDPKRYVSNAMRDYINENGEYYANQLDSLIEDELIEIIFINPS